MSLSRQTPVLSPPTGLCLQTKLGGVIFLLASSGIFSLDRVLVQELFFLPLVIPKLTYTHKAAFLSFVLFREEERGRGQL